jgi:hypothetical protein
MHPELAKGLVEQRREELTRTTVEARQARNSGPSWLSRHLPRWHVSWTRTVLSSAALPAVAGSETRGRSPQAGSSLVIIISAHR